MYQLGSEIGNLMRKVGIGNCGANQMHKQAELMIITDPAGEAEIQVKVHSVRT